MRFLAILAAITILAAILYRCRLCPDLGGHPDEYYRYATAHACPVCEWDCIERRLGE